MDCREEVTCCRKTRQLRILFTTLGQNIGRCTMVYNFRKRKRPHFKTKYDDYVNHVKDLMYLHLYFHLYYCNANG